MNPSISSICCPGMATAQSLTILLFVVLLLPFHSGVLMLANGELSNCNNQTWCVAKPWLDDSTLQANIDYACSQINCCAIRQGGLCFYPDNLISHASMAMNMYYQAMGRNEHNCDFKGSGLITITDPSYGNCKY